jgi:hypothetical protein
VDEREQAADEETLDFDAGEFARALEDDEGGEAGLGAGAGDLGAGGDLGGDFGGLAEGDAESDEGTPV